SNWHRRGTQAGMEGYEVIGTDDHKLGEGAEVDGDLLIVEGGLLRKSRHAIPLAVAHADESEPGVRVSVSTEVVGEAPKLEHGELDREAIGVHYGLVSTPEVAPDPETDV